MNITSPRRPSQHRQLQRLVMLGISALLLALALACGAAEQPREPVPPPLQAGQSGTAQSVPQPQETAIGRATGRQPGEGVASTTNAMKPDSGAPAATKLGREMGAVEPATAGVAAEQAAEVLPEPVLKAIDPQVPAAAEAIEPAVPLQEPVVGAIPTDSAQAQVIEPASQQAADPQSRQAPAQQPVAPPALQTAAESPEPLPEVGNQLGNRVPDVGLELVDGSMVSTSHLVEQGKPTFLFFTSTT